MCVRVDQNLVTQLGILVWDEGGRKFRSDFGTRTRTYTLGQGQVDCHLDFEPVFTQATVDELHGCSHCAMAIRGQHGGARCMGNQPGHGCSWIIGDVNTGDVNKPGW